MIIVNMDKRMWFKAPDASRGKAAATLSHDNYIMCLAKRDQQALG